MPRSLPRVIRVLIHYYAEDGHEPSTSTSATRGALRADLQAAQ